MYALLLAILVSAIGIAPLVIRKKFLGAGILFATTTLFWWFIFYKACPSLVWPLWGFLAFPVVINWIIGAVIDFVSPDEYGLERERPTWIAFFPVVGIVIIIVVALSGWGAFRSGEYRELIGQVEKRDFKKDMQPSDPAHIRFVPPELAAFMADKQLGEAEASIGSQFKVAKEYMTLQRIKGDLWYVAPLDYNGFSVWTSVGKVPGYVKINAEDPFRKVELVLGQSYVYTPGAYFSENLERHLWTNGYLKLGLTDYTFEEDENGKAWWVVSVFEPTISYWGKKIVGVAVVDPADGEITFHAKDKIPDWIDRAIPREFVVDYMKMWGKFPHGWLNSWWGKNELVDVTPYGKNEDYVEIVYGSDGEPYFFTGITSASKEDSALVSVMYIHTRTGKATEYKISGMTEEAVLQVVNNELAYKGWKGTAPMLFNFYDQAIWVSTVLGASNTFKGVALVDATTQKIYWDEANPFGCFVKLRAELGLEQINAPLSEKGERTQFLGIVERVAKDGANYYLLVKDIPHALAGTAGISLELVFTQPGDAVTGEYIDSGEDVYSLAAFDNLSVVLEPSAKQLKAGVGRGVELLE
ncbi:hypothetical protein HZB94_03945 [Candidatus Falkowbacteria bacterium]|nr:hypothetical protein [Candidatus Falkowbacteria bacterium]